ncbi:MAG: 2-hydroxyacid dehydrogenase [Bacillota bacterium]|nr:2-hydroxyacid dehydrogenase [Bacillota bacterium]
MKCVVVGDIFITPEMMEKAMGFYHDRFREVKSFYFGNKDRQNMRDVVKTIEMGGPYSVKPPDGVLEELSDADVLMVHLCPVTKEMIHAAKKLKVILCNRGGIENIDIDEVNSCKIPILTNPAHNANAVAEYTIGLIFNELRNISRAYVSLREHCWREHFPNSENIKELKNMTVGIIGYGAVGRLVTEKLRGFDCRVIIYDPYVDNDDDSGNPNIRFVPMDYLLRESDIVTMHARSVNKKPIIGEKELKLMKDDAYLINTSRSYMLDMDALYTALKNNWIKGAAVDVFPVEPLQKDEPLLTLDNITLTNHRGGDTLNAYSDSPLMMLREAEKLFENETPRYWYNKNMI